MLLTWARECAFGPRSEDRTGTARMRERKLNAEFLDSQESIVRLVVRMPVRDSGFLRLHRDSIICLHRCNPIRLFDSSVQGEKLSSVERKQSVSCNDSNEPKAPPQQSTPEWTPPAPFSPSKHEAVRSHHPFALMQSHSLIRFVCAGRGAFGRRRSNCSSPRKP